jgi:N-acyl-D-aspartate/D-glutamate deacylase
VNFETIVEGGRLVDGLGGPAVVADVGVREGRIAAIGDLAAAEAGRRIDARDRVVAPGFVDIHSHSDFTLLVDPSADSALAQGVTTEIVGNCGHGCAPIGLEEDSRFTANIYGWAAGLRPIDWRTVGGYLAALDDARPAINVATLVPFGNLRLMYLDEVRRPADGADIRRMARALDEAMDEGAVGLSTGLEYPAEHAAGTEELEALCARVAARGRVHAMHTRDRGRGVVEGTAEAVALAARTGVRTQVAHVLARRGSGPPDANETIAGLLEDAARDHDLAWDVHTRLFGITNLATALAPGVRRPMDPGDLRVGTNDDTVIASFGRAGWDRTFLKDAGARWSELTRGPVADYASIAGLEPAEVLMAVLRDAADDGDVNRPMAFALTYEERDIVRMIETSRCAVASYGTSMLRFSVLLSRGNRGAFSWAAWFLHRAVGHYRVLPLEPAIRRITSLPADQAGLSDRGRIMEGARADLVVFDLARVHEPHWVEPATLATGVDHVLVNGVAAWAAGRPTGERAGEVIRA